MIIVGQKKTIHYQFDNLCGLYMAWIIFQVSRDHKYLIRKKKDIWKQKAIMYKTLYIIFMNLVKKTTHPVNHCVLVYNHMGKRVSSIL